MNQLFSIGEMARLQNISRQTLIFYDKIGLLSPAYVNPENGYRYYSTGQLDLLDTILIMKKIGFSLEEIKEHIQSYTIERSLAAMKRQLTVIDQQIRELQVIKSRVEHRCRQMECFPALLKHRPEVSLEQVGVQWILLQDVPSPHSLEMVSLATKQCFVRAFKENLPVFYQSGAVVPYERIRQGRYTEASAVFLPMEPCGDAPGIVMLPAGRCVSTYHVGDYPSIGRAYERLLAYCKERKIQICSDSYEFAINDYLSTGDENEYITKILFYIASAGESQS